MSISDIYFKKGDIVKVIIPISTDVYDYLIPTDNLYKIGTIVNLQFRNKNKVGVIFTKTTEEITYDVNKIKPILSPVKDYILSENQLYFIDKVAKYNMTSIGNILNMCIGFKDIFDNKIIKTKIENKLFYSTPNLSDEQKNAVNEISKKLFSGFSTTLLDGVTGSGKTEVYFNIINKVLENSDTQVLILLPEIALTGQFLSKFKDRFGINPTLWHSNITPATRRDNWKIIVNGQAKVIVGTRSALFLPYKKLSLIVLDEEHDSSYKQEDRVIYHGRDMAILKSYIEKIPIILASATPSIETIYNVNTGKYSSVKLTKRFKDAILPKVELIDMKQVSLPNEEFGKSWMSKILIEGIQTNLNRKEQSLIYINRRGYAPLVLCNKCGSRLQCPNCNVYLTAHNKDNTTCYCHHCGYFMKLPKICDKCNEENSWVLCGPGIERIEEEVKYRFKNAKIATLSSDIITSQTKLNNIINEISNNNIDIIIGTQIIVKGHHFPNLTLVGVIDGDMSLSSSDLRANENTFQILTQVSGRAGRDIKEGKVIIQTYNPDNPVMQAIKNNDRDSFIKQELIDRQNLNMPPFSKLAAIILSSKNKENLEIICKHLQHKIPTNINDIMIYGPIDAPLSYIKNNYRKRFLIVINNKINIQNIITKWINMVEIPSNIKIKIDIDPYNFM